VTTDRQLVLHHLVIKGLADPEALARCTGLAPGDVSAALAILVAGDLVVERSGRLSGFAPTPAGREANQDSLAADDLRRRRVELADWYGRFEEVNAQMKVLFTAWQLVDGAEGQVLNDHSDLAYDAAIRDRLGILHQTALTQLAEVGDARLDRYAARLTHAEGAFQGGDDRRFTAPLSESYHDIWMELHHDLLASFDRQRTAADS